MKCSPLSAGSLSVERGQFVKLPAGRRASCCQMFTMTPHLVSIDEVGYGT